MGEEIELRCFYCGRKDTLEARNSYKMINGRRIIRVKSSKFDIFYCWKCRRHCIALKDEKKNGIQKTIQDSQ